MKTLLTYQSKSGSHYDLPIIRTIKYSEFDPSSYNFLIIQVLQEDYEVKLSRWVLALVLHN